MADPTVCVIVPTIGRPSLARTLNSLRRQPFRPGDRVLLVGDGPCPAARCLWDQFKLPGAYVETEKRAGDWGHTPRNLHMPHAGTTHIAALDDDDIWTNDALVTIREGIASAPDRCHMFQMTYRDPAVLWWEKVVRTANVGTPMFVLPAVGPRGTYAPKYGGDFDFIAGTLAAREESSPIWHAHIICKTGPDR